MFNCLVFVLCTMMFSRRVAAPVRIKGRINQRWIFVGCIRRGIAKPVVALLAIQCAVGAAVACIVSGCFLAVLLCVMLPKFFAPKWHGKSVVFMCQAKVLAHTLINDWQIVVVYFIVDAVDELES
jgi:hypothetical protein